MAHASTRSVPKGTCECAMSVGPVCECVCLLVNIKLYQIGSREPTKQTGGPGTWAWIPGGQRGHVGG